MSSRTYTATNGIDGTETGFDTMSGDMNRMCRRLAAYESRSSLVAVLTASVLFTAGCTGSGSQDVSAYEQRVLEIDRAFRQTLVQVITSPTTRSSVGATFAMKAANQLRQLHPPAKYQNGQMLLLNFYSLSARFLAGTSDAAEQTRLTEQLLDLQKQVFEELPFLEPELATPGFSSP